MYCTGRNIGELDPRPFPVVHKESLINSRREDHLARCRLNELRAVGMVQEVPPARLPRHV